MHIREIKLCVFFWQHLMADVYTFMTDFYDKYFVLVFKARQRSAIILMVFDAQFLCYHVAKDTDVDGSIVSFFKVHA